MSTKQVYKTTVPRKQRKFMWIEAEKKILVLRQWSDLYQFAKVL